jgi:hypothetical protein
MILSHKHDGNICYPIIPVEFSPGCCLGNRFCPTQQGFVGFIGLTLKREVNVSGVSLGNLWRNYFSSEAKPSP